MSEGGYIKASLPGERFWLKVIADKPNGEQVCRIANHLINDAHGHKYGDIVRVKNGTVVSDRPVKISIVGD